MNIHLSRRITVDEMIVRQKKHGTAPADDDVLMQQFYEGAKQHTSDIEVEEVAVITSPRLLKQFTQSSVFALFQLIESTPKAKAFLLKEYKRLKPEIIKSLSDATPFSFMERILKHTPENLKEETSAITSIITLAVNEIEETYRPYTMILIKSLPPLERLLNQNNQHLRQKIKYQDLIQSVEEIERGATDGIALEKDTFISFVRHLSLKEIQMIEEDPESRYSFTLQHVTKTAKSLDCINGQTRRFDYEDDETGEVVKIDITLPGIYLMGSLFFLSEHLGLLPGAAITFYSKAELLAYGMHTDMVYALYGTVPNEKHFRSTKAKERPIHIRNKETIGEIIQFDMDDKMMSKWRTMLSRLYARLGVRGDTLWNTQLSKQELDDVTNIVNKWNDNQEEGERLSENELAEWFFAGLVITALERQQQDSDTYLNETIIRMDEQQEADYARRLSAKDAEIRRLRDTVEQQHKSLAQLDSLRRKNAELMERLEWQEELSTVEEPVAETCETEEIIDIEDVKQRLNQSDVCFIGGDVNWQQALKKDLENSHFQLAEELSRSMSPVEKATIIVYNTATVNHGMYYRFKNSLKRNPNKPMVIYINSQSSNTQLTYRHIGQELQQKGLNQS